MVKEIAKARNRHWLTGSFSINKDAQEQGLSLYPLDHTFK